MPIIDYVPENTGSPYSLVFENPEMNKESLEYFKLSLDMAREIDAKYCMLACNHPGYGRNKEDVTLSNAARLAVFDQMFGASENPHG